MEDTRRGAKSAIEYNRERVRTACGSDEARFRKGDFRAMPKQKTHKGTKKRFRLSAKGKVRHRQSGTSHLAARMSHKRKRNLRGTESVDETDAKRIRKALCGNSY